MTAGSPAERRSPAGIQKLLSETYAIEADCPVDPFIVWKHKRGREAVYVREIGGEVEVLVSLPRKAVSSKKPSLDDLCQLVEGVSHFVCLAERCRRELPTTQLELELQAEVDKYVVLGLGGLAIERSSPANDRARFDPHASARLRTCLFEQTRFLHPEGTETGDRYRLANRLAARVTRRIERDLHRSGHWDSARRFLRKFHAAGQAEKMELCEAA